MIDSVHQNLFEGTRSIKKMSNPSISLFPTFLYKKKTHQYVKPLQCIATYQCT